MEFRVIVLLLLLFVACAYSRHIKGAHKRKQQNASSRQQIENAGDLLQANNIQQLKQLARQNAIGGRQVVELSPNNAAAINGITGNIGLPFGTMNARIDRNPLIGANGLSKTALDDIMFGNFKGLATTEGNRDIASYATQQRDAEEGGEMRQILGGQAMNGMNGMGNMMGNPQPVNLASLVAANNIAGTQGLNGFNINPSNTMAMSGGTMLNGVNPGLLAPPGTVGMANGFPGPMQGPNPAFGMQLMSQLSNMNQNDDDSAEPTHHHKRHHHHHRKHHKKSTTKLLLRLLVDKMKDIYELDKMTATSSDKKIKSETSAGKIGLTLEDLGVPKDDVHRGEQNKTNDHFKTNLSFPVTVSDDTEHEHVKLMSGEKSSKESDDDDDAKIEKILSSINLKDGSHSIRTSKKSEDLQINELADSVTKDLVSKYVDTSPKALPMPVIKGREMRDEKATSRDTIQRFPIPASIEHDLEMESKGSLSEFHKVKLDDENMLDSGIKSDLTPDEKTHLSQRVSIFGIKEPGSLDNAQVTAPELMAISSFLNDKKSQRESDGPETSISSNIEDSLPDLIPDKRIMNPSSEFKMIELPLSDTNKDDDSMKNLTESLSQDATIKLQDGAKYVKAAHVLGSVFKKVKDPVAKTSIETAIKAMLKVMKFNAKDSSTTKKHHFPTGADIKLLEQIDNLNNVMRKMKRKRREYLLRRSKVAMTSGKHHN